MENMDNYPCTLMGNEYSPAKFKDRLRAMTWAKPIDENGKSKFELFERHDDWRTVIRPDNINIIDWINLPDAFYQIGSIIEGIQRKLRSGIAIVVTQKDFSKQLGLGGSFGMHLCSLYLAMDFERLTVMKAKAWVGHNPNKEVYGFKLFDKGTLFQNIRPLKKCVKCWGTGKTKTGECDVCLGSGWIDA